MKLNQDLVRDIMIHLEESWPAGQIDKIVDPQYDVTKMIRGALDCGDEDLVEHLKLLLQAGYLEGQVCEYINNSRDFLLEGVTWTGHEFTANIHDSQVWKKTKSKAAEISTSVSISMLSSIATQVIKQALQIP